MNAKENESGLGNLKVSSLPRFPTNFHLSLTIPLSCDIWPHPLKKKGIILLLPIILIKSLNDVASSLQ